MDELFLKYKQRILALNISTEDKEKIYNQFYEELQFKLLDSFFETLTEDQKKSIEKADTDEEAIRIFFDLLNESVEIPEFLQFIEQIYTDTMTKMLADLPSFEISNPPATS